MKVLLLGDTGSLGKQLKNDLKNFLKIMTFFNLQRKNYKK